ncbi:MAG: hypothetical protein EKK41_19630 [Hyphomicrobiales bacterium]|nr:MAG: hypothetical protein EKK41_19630 [Hyphomicrobiales bacterium]
MNEAREKTKFKDALEKLIKGFVEAMRPSAPVPYLGASHGDPLEHTTRAEFIDNVLIALGWMLKKPGGEMIEEARIKDETTLFLDYLGVNPDRRAPQLIVEAKAWSKPMVAASEAAAATEGQSTKFTRIPLIAAAIEHCKAGGAIEASPVTAEWARWIAKLRDYVVGTHAKSGHAVSRAVLTSGQWMVVFTDPANAFINPGDVNTAGIQIFLLENYVEQSAEIFDLLAYHNLVDRPPDYIVVSRARAFLAAGSIKSVHRALWLRRQEGGAHFRIHPQLYLYAAAVVQRVDGVVVTILDDQSENAVPHDMNEFAGHCAAVQAASDALLDAIKSELGELPEVSGVEAFPGFVLPPTKGAILGVVPPRPVPKRALLKSYRLRADEFLLVTGVAAHFLLQEPTVAPCAGHDWGMCDVLRSSKGAGPILARSVKPMSFFRSGEDHHCAHRVVHDRREERCLVMPFEEFLCCRACVLQRVCWAEAELGGLPCGTASPVRRNVANSEKVSIGKRP